MVSNTSLDHIKPHKPRASTWRRATTWTMNTIIASRGNTDHGGLTRSSSPANELFFILDILSLLRGRATVLLGSVFQGRGEVLNLFKFQLLHTTLPTLLGNDDMASCPPQPSSTPVTALESLLPTTPSTAHAQPHASIFPASPLPWKLRTMANSERTFIAIKPDGVQRGLVGEIIKRFEQKGFRLVGLKFLQASEDLLKEHYTDLKDRPFFTGLVKYMHSGPVVAMVWEGLNVVKTGRVMLGETNPADSKPGTIRGDFCIQVGRNIIHGSDSVKSAEKEISLWFQPEELVEYKSCAQNWIYE